MPFWSKPGNRYTVVKRKGEWIVLELEQKSGNEKEVGRYDTEREARNRKMDLQQDVRYVIDSEVEKEYRELEKDNKEREKKEASELVERARNKKGNELHNERLAQRQAEYEHYKTRWQKRRDERL